MPGITFTVMMLWPWLEPRWTKDRENHNLLQKPRDAPFRTAFGVAVFVFYAVLFLAGSNDVIATIFRVAPETITESFRVLVFLAPIVAYWITHRICSELKGTDLHPAKANPPHEVIRTPEGGYVFGGHGDAHGEDEGHHGDESLGAGH